MNVFVLVALGLSLCSCSSVYVQVGDRSFPLEAVKVLKDLMETDSEQNPRVAETSSGLVCRDPVLPQVFRPVCEEQGAATTLSRLVTLISPVDPCEICVNPSCYGCHD